MEKQVFQLLPIFALLTTFAYTANARYGDATWYNPSVGLTACGTQHGDYEMIAATSFSHWTTPNPNNDPMCQKSARVTDPQSGKSIIVRIRDKCYGCGPDDIDLSLGAFQELRNPDVGRFKVNWDFI